MVRFHRAHDSHTVRGYEAAQISVLQREVERLRALIPTTAKEA